MKDLLLVLGSIAFGTYYAESIREKVPALANPASKEK